MTDDMTAGWERITAGSECVFRGDHRYSLGTLTLCGLKFHRRYDNYSFYAWKFEPMYVYELADNAPSPRGAGDSFFLNSVTGAIYEGEWSTVSPRLHIDLIRPAPEKYTRSVQARIEAEKFMSEWMREGYFGYGPAVLEWHIREAERFERAMLIREGIL